MDLVKVRFNTFLEIQEIYLFCKTLNFYNAIDYQKKFPNLNTNWPGHRTEDINSTHPIFFSFLKEKLVESSIPINKYKKIFAYCHLRLQGDNETDFIHADPCDTVLIYVSSTNYNSGTDFYDSKKNLVTSCKFIQNTMISFTEGMLHSSVNNHGHSIEDGRMTINIFMTNK